MAVDFVVDAVMTALGLEGNDFQRPTIEFYVDEVNEYLKDAGVPEDVIGTKPTVGIVARGVADLWSYGAGNGKLSIYFKERAIQLASTSSGGGGGGSSDLPPVTPADDGKVLTVVDGQWSPSAIPAELPEVTAADNGKALRVVNGEWSPNTIPSELPTVTTEDNGKVLTVVNGAWEVAELPTPTPGAASIMRIDVMVSGNNIVRIYDHTTGRYISFADLWTIGFQNVGFISIYGLGEDRSGTPIFQTFQGDKVDFYIMYFSTETQTASLYVDKVSISIYGTLDIVFSSVYDGRPIE